MRLIAYYESGVDESRAVKLAMVDLYKLVELLEGWHGGGEDQLVDGLKVPKSSFKRIKKLANRKELDFRHATTGETMGADAEEVTQAREDARYLVQRFIEDGCYDEARREDGVASDSLQ